MRGRVKGFTLYDIDEFEKVLTDEFQDTQTIKKLVSESYHPVNWITVRKMLNKLVKEGKAETKMEERFHVYKKK